MGLLKIQSRFQTLHAPRPVRIGHPLAVYCRIFVGLFIWPHFGNSVGPIRQAQRNFGLRYFLRPLLPAHSPRPGVCGASDGANPGRNFDSHFILSFRGLAGICGPRQGSKYTVIPILIYL